MKIDKRYANRDASIEFIRIIACFIVICLHTSSWYISGGTILKSELLIKSFLQDAVPVFWFIVGFFLFNRPKSFLSLMKKTFWQIICPAFFIMILFQLFGPWLSGKTSFESCFTSPYIDINNLFGNLFQWKSSMTLCGHLWYVFSYVKVILWYPLISLVCKEGVHQAKIRRYLLLLTLIATLINDIQEFYILPTGRIIPFFILDNSLFYVLLGYEIQTTKDIICKQRKIWFFVGLFCFIAANLSRYCLSYFLLLTNLENDYFLHINNFTSYISSCGFFICLLSVLTDSRFSSKYHDKIIFISKYTFWIYLIHRGIYEKLNVSGIRSYFYSFSQENFILKIVSMLLYSLLIFSISLLCSIVIKKVQFLFVFLRGKYVN